jgi:pimeloyl-ACP methyl ester carboxylesterase
MSKLPLKTKIYKTLKKVPILRPFANVMKKYIGSTDYKNASEIMRGVLVQSINVDMIEDIKKIKCPTLLIWGTLDEAVPLTRAYELEKLIPDSGVVVYEGATHYAYLERINEVISVLDSFFNIRR